MKNNNKKITIIITLFKTPTKKIYKLNQYKNFKNIIFNQESNKFFKKIIKKKIGFEFRYYSSKKNIGLSKASNFLLNKVNTKYCLFTQADIIIDEKAINQLAEILSKKKDVIFIAPNFNYKHKNKIQEYKYVKKLDIACMLCDVQKLKKIGFFDEDFFLYWEDIFLIDKIKKSNYKMIYANNIKAIHDSSKSTEDTLSIKFIRSTNFKYGELLYDYKTNILRFLKIFRQFFQNLLFLITNIFLFKGKQSLNNLANMVGIVKFLKFLLMKKVFSLINL
jgi:GT2 family glycosyltransferase